MSNSTEEMSNPSEPKRGRHIESENEENKDRLSNLPDCILLHILSFVSAEYAVRTCVLSTRWKDLWKRLPTLLLHSGEFGAIKRFDKLVSTLLSLRDDSVSLEGLDLERRLCIESRLLRKVISYAISHNVRRLGIAVACDVGHIPPPYMFSSQTLTSLKLNIYPQGSDKRSLFPKSLDLPALTSLHLSYYAFDASDDDVAEPFSVFTRLNSLIIENCNLSDAQILRISSETLANLTVLNYYCEDMYTIQLHSPSLRSFAFGGIPCQKLCASNVSSLEQVNIDAEMNSHGQANFDGVTCSLEQSNFDVDASRSKPSFVLLSWLVELANIKSLTVSASTLQVLFLIPHLLKLKVPILGSLKSMKVKMKPLSYGFFKILKEAKLRNVPVKSRKAAAAKLQKAFKEGESSCIPDGILYYLRQNSPSAKVDIIRCSR